MKKGLSILATGFILQLTTMSFGRFAYTLVLPEMMHTLGFTNTMMGIFGMCIVLGYLLNSFLSGKISSIIGESRTIQLSTVLSSASLAALGYFTSVFALFPAFIGLGAGASGAYIPLISILNIQFRNKGTAFGAVMGGTGAGIMLCGYLLPLLLAPNSSSSYQTAWYTLATVNLLSVGMAFIFLRPGNDSVKKTNASGSIQKSTLQIIRENKPLILTILVYFLLGFSFISYSTFFGAYSINECGFLLSTAGMMWSLFGINTIYSGMFWGYLSDRLNKISICIIINSILALSVIIILPLPLVYLFYSSTFLFGFAFLGFIITITTLISDEVDKAEMAKVFGASTLIHGSGQVAGTFLTGFLKDITHTFKLPFSLSAVMLAVSIVILYHLKKLTDK
ncbi:MAG: YbfB/YjiJ family MFS transporter [Spirochaetota bacterium]